MSWQGLMGAGLELVATLPEYEFWEGVIWVLVMFLLGAGMGSFACCQVRRMRRAEKDLGRLPGRSVCEKCGYQLRWWDNIPIVSWLALGGKCRKCKAEIGRMEIMAEGLGGAIFALVLGSMGVGTNLRSGAGVWYFWGEVVLLTGFLTGLLMLGLYDAKWKVMPVKILWGLVILGAMLGGMRVAAGRAGVDVRAGGAVREAVGRAEDGKILVWLENGDGTRKILPERLKENALEVRMSEVLGVRGIAAVALEMGGAIVVLAGIYLVLYKVSKEKLVGSGDWILGLALALAVGRIWEAVLVLFVANLTGSVVALPLKMKGKAKSVPMAPFLGVGCVIVMTLMNLI